MIKNQHQEQDFSELCACCQGALPDIDEPLALVHAFFAKHRQDQPPQSNPNQAFQWPQDIAGRVILGTTVYGSIAGIYYGFINYTYSRKAYAGLHSFEKQASEKVASLNDVIGPEKTAKTKFFLEKKQVKQLTARIKTLQASKSMQTFIGLFAGAIPMLSSVLMLAGIFIPTLSLVATVTLSLYCVSHATRYMLYEYQRATQVIPAKTIRAVTTIGDKADPLAQVGIEQFKTIQAKRRRMFAQISTLFMIYGVGATLFTYGSIFSYSLTFMAVSAILLLVGAVAVTILNNGAIRLAFVNNQDKYVQRQFLIGQKHALRELAFYSQEAKDLQQLKAALGPADSLRQRCFDTLYLIFICLVTFGTRIHWLSQAQHRRRSSYYRNKLNNKQIQEFIVASCKRKEEYLRAEVKHLENKKVQDNQESIHRFIQALTKEIASSQAIEQKAYQNTPAALSDLLKTRYTPQKATQTDVGETLNDLVYSYAQSLEERRGSLVDHLVDVVG